MKVFHFDPTTGRRGDLIENIRRASWASTGVPFATDQGTLAPIEYRAPVGFGSGAEVTVHMDAGITDSKCNDISYRHETEWRCFCLGEFHAGTDSMWDWVVLPPSNLIEEIQADPRQIDYPENSDIDTRYQ